MIPWRPPIAFWRTVGQASFHTAWAIGPSMIERSKRRAGGAAGSADDPGTGSARDGAVTDRSADKKSDHSTGPRAAEAHSAHALQRAPHVGVGQHDGRLTLQRIVVPARESIAGFGRGQ